MIASLVEMILKVQTGQLLKICADGHDQVDAEAGRALAEPLEAQSNWVVVVGALAPKIVLDDGGAGEGQVRVARGLRSCHTGDGEREKETACHR